MTCTSPSADPIDAVVTWVDGEDPAHKAKLNAYLGKLETVPEIASADRYRETGEFAYCIASLLRFAPWLRRIWIVTDAQEPAFMPAIRSSAWRDKVVVVDHKELFAGYEQHLPTFNVRTLISTLWRIPGLADRFIFLNDDFALLRPVAAADFFRGEMAVLRGCWRPQPFSQLVDLFGGAVAGVFGRGTRPVPRPGNHQGQSRAARMAGYRWRYFRVPHVPHPLLRPLYAEYFGRHPELLEANLRHRLRSPDQFLADALMNHLALRQGRAVVDNRLRVLRLNPSHYEAPRLERALASAEADARVTFVCLQSLEAQAPERRALLFRWLERRIGSPGAIFAGDARAAGC
jgi:hypothetical protein